MYSLIIALIYFCSCSPDYKKYTGIFKSINQKNAIREMTVRHVRNDEFQITYMDGQLIFKGIKKGNRIVATYKQDPYMTLAGIVPDSTKSFYDFNEDGNQITVASEDMNSIEIFIRVK